MRRGSQYLIASVRTSRNAGGSDVTGTPMGNASNLPGRPFHSAEGHGKRHLVPRHLAKHVSFGIHSDFSPAIGLRQKVTGGVAPLNEDDDEDPLIVIETTACDAALRLLATRCSQGNSRRLRFADLCSGSLAVTHTCNQSQNQRD